MARQVLVDFEELERLQKRVVELEAVAREAEKNHEWAFARAGELLQRAERAESEAAEQRKRAEEAEAALLAAQMNAIENAEVGADMYAEAIEKARQEERERCARFVAECAGRIYLPDEPWKIIRRELLAMADAIRALKSTKDIRALTGRTEDV